eukprot:scaffold201055_cov29-Tisochrysis_lutea.AAC.8
MAASVATRGRRPPRKRTSVTSTQGTAARDTGGEPKPRSARLTCDTAAFSIAPTAAAASPLELAMCSAASSADRPRESPRARRGAEAIEFDGWREGASTIDVFHVAWRCATAQYN